MELKYVTRTGKKLKVYKTKNGAYFIRRPNGKRYLNLKQIKESHKRSKKKVKMKGGVTSNNINNLIRNTDMRFVSDYNLGVYKPLKFSQWLKQYRQYRLPNATNSKSPLESLKDKVLELYRQKTNTTENSELQLHSAFSKILRNIYSRNGYNGWYKYHSKYNRKNATQTQKMEVVIADEVQKLLNFNEDYSVTNPELTKNPETHIASIYLSLAGLLKGMDPDDILRAIHDVWCRTALRTLNRNKVTQKANQFRQFGILKNGNKVKDLVWIESVHDTLF